MNRRNAERLADSWEPDPARSLGSVGPFRVADGRAVIDARGRVVAMATSGRQWDEMTGATFTVADAIGASEADGNAHAIARALNAATGDPWRDFLAHVERQRDAEGDGRRRELLARLAGSVRAVGGIPKD